MRIDAPTVDGYCYIRNPVTLPVAYADGGSFRGGTTAGNGLDGYGSGNGVGGYFVGGNLGIGVIGYAGGGGNINGIQGYGSGTGSGIYGVPGTGGAGVVGVGTSGWVGVYGNGVSSGIPGGYFQGGSGNSDGVQGVGTGTGNGGNFTGGSAGNGIYGQGNSSGYGGAFYGGSTGQGILGHGGSNPNGNGVIGQGIGAGAGGQFTGGTTRAPISLATNSSAPTSITEGDIYVNNTNHTVNFALGSSPAWTAMSTAAGLSGGVSGGIGFFSGASTFTHNDSYFHWDNTNHRVGINTNIPAYTLDSNGSVNALGAPLVGWGVTGTGSYGQLIAAGDGGKLATSVDGVNWVQQTSSFGGTDIIRSVAYNSNLLNQWIADGYSAAGNGKLANSSDAINWTQDSYFSTTHRIYASAFGYDINLSTDVWMMVGDGYIVSSTDGIHWTNRNPATGGRIFYGIDFDVNNARWVIGGTSGEIEHSTDAGATWSTASGGPNIIYGVSYNLIADQWIVVGYNNGSQSVAYSFNGASSFTLPDVSTSLRLYAVASDNKGNSIAVGTAGTMIKCSGSAQSWNTVTSSFGSTDIYSICYDVNMGKWFAAGAQGKIATSSNGTTWTQVSSTSFSGSDNIYVIAYENYVANAGVVGIGSGDGVGGLFVAGNGSGDGIVSTGTGNNYGIYATGGPGAFFGPGGAGIYAVGGGPGDGTYALGSGVGVIGTGGTADGVGIMGFGTGTGNGIEGTGGSSGGTGIVGTGASTGDGGKFTGGSNGHGASITGGGANVAALAIAPQAASLFGTSGSAGDIAVSNETGKLWEYNGSAWDRLVPQVYSQVSTTDSKSSSGYYATSYTLPAGTFRAGATIRIRGHVRVTTYTTGPFSFHVDLNANSISGTMTIPDSSHKAISFDIVAVCKVYSGTGTVTADTMAIIGDEGSTSGLAFNNRVQLSPYSTTGTQQIQVYSTITSGITYMEMFIVDVTG